MTTLFWVYNGKKTVVSKSKVVEGQLKELQFLVLKKRAGPKSLGDYFFGRSIFFITLMEIWAKLAWVNQAIDLTEKVKDVYLVFTSKIVDSSEIRESSKRCNWNCKNYL
jgi:hypothetical protein